MRKILIASFFFCLSLTSAMADGFSSLEEQMTGKEFMAAGLDKLSQEELDALNAWIRNRSLGTLDAPRAAVAAGAGAASTDDGGDRRGFPSWDGEEDEPIRSRIVGEFNGWDGQTIFKLENGMIWVQDDRDKFFARDVENPVAVIEPGMFDSWHLHIEGYRAECKVKRIQ